MNELMARLGDNNTRIRERTEGMLVYMASNRLVGASAVIQSIVKKGAVGDMLPRHAVGRFNLLTKVLQK